MKIRRAVRFAGLSIALFLSAAVVYLLLVVYLGEPVGRLYQTVRRLFALAPQDWIWAVLIALFVLIGLRNLTARRRASQSEAPQAQYQPESLESWLSLLHERNRGGYFRWRLANRLADLESRIGGASDAPPQIREYLQMGRDQRTIHASIAMSKNSLEIASVITFLESNLEGQHES